jgi:hypothetical protein
MDNKKTVTKSALIRRINRDLAKEEQVLKVQRSKQYQPYYIVDLGTNSLACEFDDLEKWALDNGYLKPYESCEY